MTDRVTTTNTRCLTCGERIERNSAIGWIHSEHAETGFGHTATPAPSTTDDQLFAETEKLPTSSADAVEARSALHRWVGEGETQRPMGGGSDDNRT